MVNTTIFNINHYKNLTPKMHFTKYFHWHYKGHNLAMLTLISKPRHHRAPYHATNTKSLSHSHIWIYWSNKSGQNGDYLSILGINGSCSLVSLYIVLKKSLNHQNRHFMLRYMVFVPTPYIKVSVSYNRVIE